MPDHYRLKETEIEYEAHQHDGSDETANRIAQWVTDNGGKVKVALKGTVDYDLHSAFVMIKNPTAEEEDVVMPFDWVIHVAPHTFHVRRPQRFLLEYRFPAV